MQINRDHKNYFVKLNHVLTLYIHMNIQILIILVTGKVNFTILYITLKSMEDMESKQVKRFH